MSCNFGVIGVGNMAKAILAGMIHSELSLSGITLFDKNEEQYKTLSDDIASLSSFSESISQTVDVSDYILLSVKPQNFPEMIEEIKQCPSFSSKLYISIAAGIESESISKSLNGACVIRVLPNLPMTVGAGVSLICENKNVSDDDMAFVQKIFRSSGSILMIREEEMNRMIGVTSSSPAYVFRFVQAICEGAMAQGLHAELLDVVCDVLIGSALLLKQSGESPKVLADRVASRGGTTERALRVLDEQGFDRILRDAMTACTQRADELGKRN